MQLNEQGNYEFLELYQPLIYYAGQQKRIVEKGYSFEDWRDIESTQGKFPCREDFVNNPSVLIDFIKKNPFNFSEIQLNHLREFKYFIKGGFYLIKHLKNYSIFLKDDVAYGVLALTALFQKIFGNRLPVWVLTVFYLTPFYGQNVELDTVFVKRTVGENEFRIDTLFISGGSSSTQVLAGTTFLPYSDKMIGLLNHGVSPINLEIIQECDNSTDPRTFKDYPKFIEVSRDRNELSIDVSIVANCCHNFLGEAEVTGNDTLNLVYTSYGGFCSCNCCFTLRYTFDTTMEEYYQILRYVTINGSKSVGQIPKKE